MGCILHIKTPASIVKNNASIN